jgi:2-dehydro-3-deoxyphosphogluconate aldolase/(4S)-4-hydroxy-2-oxoglutarate aldolase
VIPDSISKRIESTGIGALRFIRAEVPDMLAGADTVLPPRAGRRGEKRGSRFAVSPRVNPRVMPAAKEAGLPFALRPALVLTK